MGTIGQCSSDNIYGRKMMASWTASDITSLLPPTASPTSSVTYLSGYLTTFLYSSKDRLCSKILSTESVKLDECRTKDQIYMKTIATSTVVTTMTYSDAFCQTLLLTNYNYYAAGSCVVETGYNFRANYSISSKITTDLTVPRVTRM
jgi:hypothetical protein